jgi:hypothetical protein
MAHLWTMTAENEWAIEPLAHEVRTLDSDGDVLLLPAPLSPRTPGVPTAWALIVGTGTTVRLNGAPLRVGIAILNDRDEIRVATAAPLFFSTESLAVVTPFPPDGPRGACPRCKQPIVGGTTAVKCPGCGIWHHQADDLPCWQYASHCAMCEQDTASDAPFRWTPEELM